MDTATLSVIVPKHLIDRLDAVGTILMKERPDLVRQALQDFLRSLEEQQSLQKQLIELYLDEEIALETLEKSLGDSSGELCPEAREILDKTTY